MTFKLTIFTFNVLTIISNAGLLIFFAFQLSTLSIAGIIGLGLNFPFAIACFYFTGLFCFAFYRAFFAAIVSLLGGALFSVGLLMDYSRLTELAIWSFLFAFVSGALTSLAGFSVKKVLDHLSIVPFGFDGKAKLIYVLGISFVLSIVFGIVVYQFTEYYLGITADRSLLGSSSKVWYGLITGFLTFINYIIAVTKKPPYPTTHMRV